MSEYYGGDDNGYYDENDEYNYYNGNFGGPPGSGGGYEQYPTYGPSGLPTFTQTGTENTGGPTRGQSGGQSFSNPFGNGTDYFNMPFVRTGGLDTGGGNPATGGGGPSPSIPSGGGNSLTNNTQNNTQNNSTGYSQSVSLAPTAAVASGVPQSPASSFKPNVISSGGLREGAPPPMPTPHTRVPPSLHPETPTDWSGLASGGSAAPQTNSPNSNSNHPSTLGKVAGVLGALGLIPNLKPYQGVYEALKPKKTPEQINAAMYSDIYGGM